MNTVALFMLCNKLVCKAMSKVTGCGIAAGCGKPPYTLSQWTQSTQFRQVSSHVSILPSCLAAATPCLFLYVFVVSRRSNCVPKAQLLLLCPLLAHLVQCFFAMNCMQGPAPHVGVSQVLARAVAPETSAGQATTVVPFQIPATHVVARARGAATTSEVVVESMVHVTPPAHCTAIAQVSYCFL